jgi:hypothetical protein
MNTQLVESLVRAIRALPDSEQALLKSQLMHSEHLPNLEAEAQYPPILQSLIEMGRITPPVNWGEYQRDGSHQSRRLDEAEFRAMVSQIKIVGQPLSETAIEERGEW